MDNHIDQLDNDINFDAILAAQLEQDRLDILCQFRLELRKNGSSSIVPFFANLDEVREVRADLLIDADVSIKKAEDAGKDTQTLRIYRQALRDVTEQNFDFNTAFNPFPVKPMV
jgi:hypothetical protein